MFVEAVRLLITLSVLVVGYNVGGAIPAWFPGAGFDSGVPDIWGAVLGAGCGYVIGGVIGRALDRSMARAPQVTRRTTGPELFAGAFGLITGIIVGGVLAVPTIVFLPHVSGWPLAGLIVLILAAFGARVFAARSDDLLALAGLRRAPRSIPEGAPDRDRFVLDTSAAIDGRVLDLVRAGLIRDNVWVPAFVIDELQGIADSSDRSRRRRGRRGLDVLEALGETPGVSFLVLEDSVPQHSDVDAKLLALAAKVDCGLITTDHNLAKAASVRGLRVINPHSIGESLRPEVAAGDVVEVSVDRAGNEPGQGIAFLDDGTMVVIANGAAVIGSQVSVEVTNTLRTSVGRMVFASLAESATR